QWHRSATLTITTVWTVAGTLWTITAWRAVRNQWTFFLDGCQGQGLTVGSFAQQGCSQGTRGATNIGCQAVQQFAVG
ncbi:hypothetical protein SB758_42985, partial [Burkholderia sp. SIMBA_013]